MPFLRQPRLPLGLWFRFQDGLSNEAAGLNAVVSNQVNSDLPGFVVFPSSSSYWFHPVLSTTRTYGRAETAKR